MQTNILPRIQSILADQFGINESEATVEKSLHEDFGMDSLDAVEIALAIDEEFDIDLPDEDFENAKTVAALVALVTSKLSSTDLSAIASATLGH